MGFATNHYGVVGDFKLSGTRDCKSRTQMETIPFLNPSRVSSKTLLHYVRQKSMPYLYYDSRAWDTSTIFSKKYVDQHSHERPTTPPHPHIAAALHSTSQLRVVSSIHHILFSSQPDPDIIAPPGQNLVSAMRPFLHHNLNLNTPKPIFTHLKRWVRCFQNCDSQHACHKLVVDAWFAKMSRPILKVRYREPSRSDSDGE